MDALTRPNVQLYRHHLAGTGQENLLRDSWYIHAFRDPTEAKTTDLAWRLREQRGAPIERVDGQALREVEPALSPNYKAAILLKDQARVVSPGRLGAVLAEKARAMGAQIIRASVEQVQPSGDQSWTLLTDAGEFSSPTIVVAAGAWSTELLRPLGVVLPLEAERGYHLTFRDPEVTLRNSVMGVERKFVVSTVEDGLRSAGTAEFAGLDTPANYRRARIFESLTKRLLPDLNTDNTQEWMGVRPPLRLERAVDHLT